MGVSGSGKSTIGKLLSERLDIPFIDGDDLHPPANVRKMAAGHPLSDEDRWPWLRIIGQTLSEADRAETGLIVACSALKRSYRDAIREVEPRTRFVHLAGSAELLASRMKRRRGHYMPIELLESQLEALEPLAGDEPGATVSVEQGPDEVAQAALAALG